MLLTEYEEENDVGSSLVGPAKSTAPVAEEAEPFKLTITFSYFVHVASSFRPHSQLGNQPEKSQDSAGCDFLQRSISLPRNLTVDSKVRLTVVSALS